MRGLEALSLVEALKVNWLLNTVLIKLCLQKKYLAPLVREMPKLRGGMSPDLDPTIKLDIPIFMFSGIEPKQHAVRSNQVGRYHLVCRSLKKKMMI